MLRCTSAVPSRHQPAKRTVPNTTIVVIVSAIATLGIFSYLTPETTICNACGPMLPNIARRTDEAPVPVDASTDRFIVMAAVTEQLGKAMYHVDDVLELCLLSNRTCVLPGISNGQFALDGYLNFDHIFDVEAIPSELRVISWEQFTKRMRHNFSPRVVMCALGKEALHSRTNYLVAFERAFMFYQRNATFEYDDACSTSMIGFPADRVQQVANLKATMSVLSRSDESIVAIFHVDWSEPLPKPTALASVSYTGLDFSDAFYEQALAFRERVGDYIHLQWRMEKADGREKTNYTACALAAIRHVRNLERNSTVKNLYFSSDLGRDGVPWSNSFGGTVPKDALNALKLIYEEFPSVLTWVNVSTPSLPRYDIAAIGAMDRLIAMGSTYFVRGPKSCSRVGAYVQSIAKWREKRLSLKNSGKAARYEEFGSRIQNEVDEFHEFALQPL